MVYLHKYLSKKMIATGDLLSIKEASMWASTYLGKSVTSSNISYLVQYGRVKKIGDNGSTQVSKTELMDYYKSYNGNREIAWKDQLGDDLNWALSFDQYKEAETTKHVHRLHPYKGKFVPQLVKYFLDDFSEITLCYSVQVSNFNITYAKKGRHHIWYYKGRFTM